MRTATFRQRMQGGEPLAGTFVKTPSHEVIEVLAMSGLDFLCLDAEHSPFDRARTDVCLAMARALDMPCLVRVPAARPDAVLQALDSGAVGVVVPHVDDAATAATVARAARFGAGGRGYAGSTRWGGFATRPMPDLIAQSRDETVVIVQIESPEAVGAAAEIAAVEGVDGLFIGPADLTVAYGETDTGAPPVAEAYARVGAAAAAAGVCHATFVASPAQAAALRPHGLTMFFVASEHVWMLQGARAVAAAMREPD